MKCKICDNDKDNKEFEVKEMMFGTREVFRYFQCSRCGCLQIEDVPHNLSDYYPKDYYSYNASVSNKSQINKLLSRLRDNYAIRGEGLAGRFLYAIFPNPFLSSMRPVEITKDTRILDVGCGSGSLLYSLKELGFSRLLGIDPYNDKAIQYKNGLEIQKKEVHEVEGKWDVVMLHHTFEHIDNPLETLQLIANLLTPNGRCIIRIPIVPSYVWEHYGVNWVQLDAPRHLFLHSVKSMNILTGQCGLKMQNVVYDSTAFQFWGSEQYVKDIPLRDKRSYSVNADSSIFTQKEIANFKKRSKELNLANQGDQAIFYLCKS